MARLSNLAKWILYADDANIIVTADSEEETYQKVDEASRNLVKWVHKNGLCLNLRKTHYMVFSNCRNKLDRRLIINNTAIERVKEARFLGVIIDEKLTWKSHIDAIRTKMSRYLGTLFRIKHVIPKSARLQIYHSFIRSHLNYCSLVWGFFIRIRHRITI